MVKFKYLFLVLILGSFITQAQESYTAPQAKKIPNQLIIHGDTLIDNYFWMRDKNSPEVINHLYAENSYADNMMRPSSYLQKMLVNEFRSRIQQNRTTRPRKSKGYLYFSRNQEGKDYPTLLRKKDSANAQEKIILDLNLLAQEYQYFSLSNYSFSPNQKLLYYGVDSKGNRVSNLFLKNLETDSLSSIDKIYNVMSMLWLEDNKSILYTKPEFKTLRQYQVYKHIIGTPTSSDKLIYEEQDKTMEIYLGKSSSKEYVYFTISKTKCSEIYYMKADGTDDVPKLFLKRDGVTKYGVDHIQGDEFIIQTNRNAINYKLVKTKILKPSFENWVTIIPHRENILLSGVRFTKDFMLVNERENAQDRVLIVNRKTNETDTLKTNLSNYGINDNFVDYDYNNSDEIEYSIENKISPSHTYSYNLYTQATKLIEVDTVVGYYNVDDYITERIYATAKDGKKIPITIAYKKGITLNGTNPLLLDGYGSYGANATPYFSTLNLSYLDRGFVLATAHPRGGNDLGNQWYEDGKMFNKKNTFTDFIACAEFLIEKKYTNPKKLAIEGASAGGLLMGAVVNMRPDLFQCVSAGVPFVDVINTMLDETLPLTTFEFEEWGNPKKRDEYKYIASYSPYENIKKQNYPNMVVFAGYNDSQVGYWEPAKFVAKLRELKTDTNELLFKTNMDGGHGGGSGRTTQYKEQAFKMAFIMKCLGVKEDYLTLKGKVIDEKNESIPFANVYIEKTTVATTTNENGEFALPIKRDKKVNIIVQSMGFVKYTQEIDTDNPKENNITIKLKSENIILSTVTVKANSKDPAYAIMKEAIKRREENQEKVKSFSSHVYMKSNVKLLEVPKKLPFFIPKKSLPDSTNLGMIYLSESVAKYHFKAPDYVKEEMIASKVAGQKSGFSWNRVGDVFISFYEPSIDMSFYSERPFISPLATGSLLSYKYKYQGSIFVDNKEIDIVEIIPRRKGDPLFNGKIYIASQENYQIYGCDLFVTKDAQIDFADTVNIKQEMVKVNDSIWMPLQLQFSSKIKVFGIKATDISTASISNYEVNKTFPKKFFSNEVFKIDEAATKKDTSFWSTTRTSILSEEEKKYYHKGDSILVRQESKEYKDSVNKAQNKFNFGETLIQGYDYQNNFKGTRFVTSPLINTLSYNTVEGLSIKADWTFRKFDKETWKRWAIENSFRYGVDNKKFSGGFRYSYRFNPKHGQSFSVNIGRYMKQYNQHEPIGTFLNNWYTLLDKHNYMKLYQTDIAQISYNHELVNGLFANASINYQNRAALQNKSFYYWIEQDRHFTSNNPLNTGIYDDSPAFNKHSLLQFQFSFRFIPYAKYETYPQFKRLLDTKWPEFSFTYKKGLSTKNANFNYDYLELGVGKDLELRALGEMTFDVSAGIFFNNSNMNFIDYKHFNGNQTLFLLNKPNSDAPFSQTRTQLSEFHGLSYYGYSTNDKFIETHISHNFRGFFISKIPLLRKTKFYEIVGLNSVITPTSQYNEVYIGIDKIFKVFRFDIASAVQSNQKIKLYYRFGFRIGF